MGHHDQEFLAAEPSTQITLSGISLQNLGEMFQNFIAGIVSEGVVDVFKSVQIGGDYPHGEIVPGGTAQFTGGPFIDCAAVWQAGHGIG